MPEKTIPQKLADAVTQGPSTKQAADEIEAKRLRDEALAASRLAKQTADRPATVPLGQGETQGTQTRGGARLGATPAGKELIGMRSGVPIYADATDVYGTAKPSVQATIAQTPLTADSTKPVMLAPQTREEQRAAYQAKQAPIAAAAMAPGKPAQTYWSPEYAKAYTQKAAQQAALARIGGQDAYDRRAAEAGKFAAERTRNLAGFEAQKNREEQFARGEIQAPNYELVKKLGVRKVASPLRKFFS
jgi:hypothetical protein